MKLWLTETERQKDFARYKGVDLHTWDRVFIDVGVNYAYLTIPKVAVLMLHRESQQYRVKIMQDIQKYSMKG